MQSNLVDLWWSGQIVDKRKICCHLGYPIGIDVSPSKSLNWISGTIFYKFINIVYHQVIGSIDGHTRN